MGAHAEDFRPFLAPGKAAIQGLRNLDSAFRVTTFAAIFILDATCQLINRYHPGEDWARWYFREVKDGLTECAESRS